VNGWRILPLVRLLGLAAALSGEAARSTEAAAARFDRVVILKVDGLNADLLYRTMRSRDSESGKSVLPWFAHVFQEQGVVFENFYTRGISLSAPSWSILDTGRHAIIRGNVEFDRYTGQVFDYLNVFPFYIGYASKKAVDMPAVEVLDEAGIPLLIDQFPGDTTRQSFQLFQRGVVWTTLRDALVRSVSGHALASLLESAVPLSLSSSLAKEIESVVREGIAGNRLLYLDIFTGEADHDGHATNDPQALLHVLQELDGLVGRLWTAIQQGPMANRTLLAVVSDHGMNSSPGVISQTFSLPDLLASPEGGAHHVVTDREQLSDYKLKGINPLVHRVITPSPRSFYLQGQASRYPTAWLDIDGNERTAIYLRNSDLNKIHILLQQIARQDIRPELRRAAAKAVCETVAALRKRWEENVAAMQIELGALDEARAALRAQLKSAGYKETTDDKARRRERRKSQQWEYEARDYRSYLEHVGRLLALQSDGLTDAKQDISELIPPMALGDNNSPYQLQHYIAGLSQEGLVLGEDGRINEEKSFRFIDYFALLASQRARNNPQANLSSRPIDFSAMMLPAGPHAALPNVNLYWLYRDRESQLLILQDADSRLKVLPVRDLRQSANGSVNWSERAWDARLPLDLFEDVELKTGSSQDRGSWLSSWHSEQEWLTATHKCRYSNGVIGITEELSPIAREIPGKAGQSELMHRYEQRRRELVQADFHVFAANHWNFNVRFPNPGGNHGSFLRISTHSVWLMAGAGLRARRIEEPYDSLNFASTVASLMGRTAPMPEKVIHISTK